ncbi:MAG: methylenetetrahydrofolate reductase [NAD(P)H] [Eubacterium sp.]|nr:methylenetetrahydrofolate reductase [NAD(P)H] [Eubacterium sp.]
MKVSEVLKNESPSLSFEVFPPKKESAFESVKEATEQVASLSPSYMSVTYGAGGGRSKFTVDVAANLMQRYGTTVVAHLTCVSSTREQVDEQIDRMKENGIDNILALRGDIPEGAPAREDWSFGHASELVSYIKERGDFCVGGACYPEGHPESEHIMVDIGHMKEKQDAGLDYFVTQMFFDNNVMYNYLFKMREAGITVPVVPGIMPFTKKSQLTRIKDLSGSFLPQRFIQMVDRFGDDPESIEEAGIAYATDQIIDLFANGINHVHVYTMNNYHVASSILDNLRHITGRDR